MTAGQLVPLLGGLVAFVLVRLLLQARDKAVVAASPPLFSSTAVRNAANADQARHALGQILAMRDALPRSTITEAEPKALATDSMPDPAPKPASSQLASVFVRESEESPADRSSSAPGIVAGTAHDAAALDRFALRPVVQWAAPTASPSGSTVAGQDRHGSNTGTARWVAPGEVVAVGGIQIAGGLIYVGGQLPSPGGWRNDQALIDPSLQVARTAARPGDDNRLQYQPDYAAITPTGRRAYLDWLAGGRADPDAMPGLVLLFFYGLERRLFHDGHVEEAPILIREVERLLSLYRAHDSFRSQAEAFLVSAALLTGAPPPAAEVAPQADWRSELPLLTRLHLGAVLAKGQGLGAEDALLWVLGLPDTRLRTPGQRCFAELRQTFVARFADRHPKGLAVRTPKRRLSVSYRAASGVFETRLPGPHENLPDITAVRAPIPDLLALLDTCQTELEAFSRLLGRRPEARDTFDGAMLLPTPARETAVARIADAARATLAPLMGGAAIATVAPARLFSALGISLDTGAKRVPYSAVNQLVHRLDALGFGLEPDRRYGGEAMAMAGVVVLFTAVDGAPVDPERPVFVQAKAVLEIATLAAAADGDVSDLEFQVLVRKARATPSLSAGEALRLEAFAWTLRDRARSGGALRRASTLPRPARMAIAQAAIETVLADGQASALEIAYLERLHRTLDLPPEAVHSALHQGSGLRAETSPTASGFVSDAERLARLRQDTAEVSQLLAGIFAEEESEPVAEAPPAATASPIIHAGLDGPHGSLLDAALAAGAMPLAAFEAEARRLRLLPEGAIDTINDWALDRFEEPVLEAEDDMIAVPDYLRAQLMPI